MEIRFQGSVRFRELDQREAERRERVEKLLSTVPEIKPASELAFDYDVASRITRRNNKTGD